MIISDPADRANHEYGNDGAREPANSIEATLYMFDAEETVDDTQPAHREALTGSTDDYPTDEYIGLPPGTWAA